MATKTKKENNPYAYAKVALRRASLRWKPRNEALKNARVARGLYECAVCKAQVRKGNYQLDHKEPVIEINSTEKGTDFNKFIPRLFCPVENFSLLCLTCHKSKTEIENAMRKHHKIEAKKKKKCTE